jgi:hypothetical protein
MPSVGISKFDPGTIRILRGQAGTDKATNITIKTQILRERAILTPDILSFLGSEWLLIKMTPAAKTETTQKAITNVCEVCKDLTISSKRVNNKFA